MAKPSRLRELQYSAESSFAENAESAASNTWTNRIPVLSYTLTTSQERIRDGAIQSRSNVEALSHLGPRDAELEFEIYWGGHGSAPTGALVQTWIQDLLSDALGGGNVAQIGGTVAAAATATSLTYAGATLVAGGIVRIGAKGDGRGEGHPVLLPTTVTTPVSLLTGAKGAPNNGDVVYACQLAYPDESTLTTLGTKRFLVGTTTTGAQYHLMGGQCSKIVFTLPVRGLPTIRLTYRFAYWQRAAVTIPSTSLTLETCSVAPITGGSVVFNDFGTATRTEISVAEMEFTIERGLEAVSAIGGAGTYQSITGWTCTGNKPMLTMRVPWDSSYETRFDLANPSYTRNQILVALNCVAGRAVGLAMPYAHYVGERPSAVRDVNGQDYCELNFVGSEPPTVTSELEKSAFRLFAG